MVALNLDLIHHFAYCQKKQVHVKLIWKDFTTILKEEVAKNLFTVVAMVFNLNFFNLKNNISYLYLKTNRK